MSFEQTATSAIGAAIGDRVPQASGPHRRTAGTSVDGNGPTSHSDHSHAIPIRHLEMSVMAIRRSRGLSGKIGECAKAGATELSERQSVQYCLL